MAPAIYYLSQVIGRPVYDPENRPLGLLGELVVRLGGPFPPVTGLTLRFGGIGKSVASRATFLHWNDVASVTRDGIRLSTVRLNLAPFQRRRGEILLQEDLLDQQVMDIHGRKLVRVNDVQLVAFNPSGSDLRLAGIDISLRGLLRRLDAEGLCRWLVSHTSVRIPDKVVPWEEIGPLSSEAPATNGGTSAAPASANGGGDGSIARHGLQLAREKLAALHPADVADLMEQLSAPERAAVIGAMAAEKAAEALGELDPEMSADVLEDLPTESAAEILAELPPDEAADTLAELSSEKADELLDALDAEDAAAVRHLMSFDEDVAGGMMTTDYVALPKDLTAEETIDRLRRLAPPAEEIHNVYVVDKNGILLGALSLRDLIVAPPGTKLSTIVGGAGEVVHVPSQAPKDEVIRVIDKYNLLALPVTDDSKRLIGVITVDDALAAALPPEPGRWLRGVMR